MKKLFKAISDRFMLMEGKDKDEIPLPFKENMFQVVKKPKHDDSDDERNGDLGSNVLQAKKWTEGGMFFSSFMPFTGKTSLSKQELGAFCKSFHNNLACNDLFWFMNEKKGRNDEGEVSMSVLDPFF